VELYSLAACPCYAIITPKCTWRHVKLGNKGLNNWKIGCSSISLMMIAKIFTKHLHKWPMEDPANLISDALTNHPKDWLGWDVALRGVIDN